MAHCFTHDQLLQKQLHEIFLDPLFPINIKDGTEISSHKFNLFLPDCSLKTFPVHKNKSPEFFLLSFLFSFIFKLMKILKRMHTFSHNWWRFIGASLTSKLHIKNCETFTSRPHYSLTRILKRGQGWAPGTRGRHNIDMRPEVSEIREGGVEMECGGGGGVRQNHYLCGEECRACVESLTLLPPPPPQPGTVSSTHTHQLNHHSRHWGHPLSSYGNGREKNVIITWGAVHHS